MDLCQKEACAAEEDASRNRRPDAGRHRKGNSSAARRPPPGGFLSHPNSTQKKAAGGCRRPITWRVGDLVASAPVSAGGFVPRPRLVYLEGPSSELRAVERECRLADRGVVEFDEPESLGLAGRAIDDHGRGVGRAEPRERVAELIVRNVVGKVTDVE